MPVVLGLIVLGVVVFWVYKTYYAQPGQPVISRSANSKQALAYLSNGFLFFREQGGELQQLHSAYAQEAMDRRERAREKQSWKKGTSFGIAAGGGMRDFEAIDRPLLATSATVERDGSLLYFLKDASVGGLFRRDAASGTETRLLIKQNLQLSDLSLSPEGDQLVASSMQTGGIANITLMNSDGSNIRDVTGGDTVDLAPAWIPGVAKRLLFQSAGLARNEQGYIVAQGQASIQMLNMESGSVSAVLEHREFDFLRPRVCPAGNLHFIRRPYDPPQYGTTSFLTDFLLFPFRLLRAVFHFLNVFSMMYSRKPLTSASGPEVQVDMKNVLLQGRRIDAQKALRSARPVHGVPSLVPNTWELVSRNPDGDERVLATNVASYDIAADGTVVYTNGCGVFVLSPDGGAQLAVRNELIGDVVALPTQRTPRPASTP